MTLTEVVYKIRRETNPLLRLTAEREDLTIVRAHASWDPTTGVGVSLLVAEGPDADVEAFLDALKVAGVPHEVLAHGGGSAVARVEANLAWLRKAGDPAALALEFFGDDAVHGPGLIQGGWAHFRVLAPHKVSLPELLDAYREGERDGLWDEFKLVRTGDVRARQLVMGAFMDELTNKQHETIKTALALGCYDTPRGATLDDLSSVFGVSKAAVHNRLQAAERKVISKFFN